MTTENNTTATEISVNDFVTNAIETERKIRSEKDWKLSERAKLIKKRDNEIDLINGAFKRQTAEIDDAISVKQIRLGFDAKILEVQALYNPQIEALTTSIEEIAEVGSALGAIGGTAVGKTIAPVTKTVGSFFGSLKVSAGIGKNK